MTLSTDAFTRADSSTLGAGWTLLAGLNPRIVANRVLPAAATTGTDESHVRFNTDTGSPDMYAQVDGKWVSDYGNLALMSRATDYNNRYFVNISQTDRKVELVRINNGNYLQLRPGTPGEFTWAVGTTVTFRLEVSGTGSTVTVTLKANGVTVFAYADSDALRLTTGQRGGFGFSFIPNATTFEVDNYSQDSLAVGTAPTASYTATPASPTVGQSVSFTDTSTGAPTSWAWMFGDESPSGYTYREQFTVADTGNLADGATIVDKWKLEFGSGGSSNGVVNGALHLESQVPTGTNTYSSLALGPEFVDSVDFEVEVRTVSQLRATSPNTWEVAWVVWNVRDNLDDPAFPSTEFYYFTHKTNGWELAKVDLAKLNAGGVACRYPDYTNCLHPGGQVYLATGSDSPLTVNGTWETWRIRHVGTSIQVWINGVLFVSHTETTGSAWNGGKVGAYHEDARVEFDDYRFTVGQLSAGGSGSSSSTVQNPTHTYTAAGTYTVTQTATNASGSSTATGTIAIVSPGSTQSDTFTRSDALSLGANWTLLSGLNPRIVTNRVLPNTATAGSDESHVRFDTDATSVNMYAQAAFKWVSDYGNVVLLARFTDLNNRYFVNINQQARKAELVRVNAGAYTQLRPGVDGEFVWAVGTTVTFRLEVSTSGSIVTVVLKANGVTVFAFSDTAADRLTIGQRGGIGFAYVPNATAFEIDNYEQGTLGASGAVSVALNAAVVATVAQPLTTAVPAGFVLDESSAGVTDEANQPISDETASLPTASITLKPLSFTIEAVPLRAPQPAAPPGTIPPVPSTYQPTPQQKLTRWNVYALNADGQRVAELDDYTNVDIIERRNRIGAWRLVHHANLAADLLTLDRYGVEFVRNGQTVMSGPVTVRQRTQNGTVDQYEFGGVDDLAYVSWRLASPQPSSYGPSYNQSHDVRTGPAASVIAAYVNANAGPGAIPPRRTPGLTVGANLGLGASVIGRARWQNLLDFITGLAAVGGVVFSCKRRVFQVHVPVDRSATVRLSIQLGTAQAVTYNETVPTVNHPVVGASGELTARLMLERDDAASQERWGRIESFVDRRDTSDPAEMLQAAVEALVEGGAKTGLTVNPIPAVGYGAYDDYQVGDLVTAVVGGVAFVDVVDEVQTALTAEGETIIPTVGATEANPQRPRFFELVAKNRRALRDLERR